MRGAVEEKGGYPADVAKVQQALLGLADLTFVEPKTRKPDLYPRLEVEDADKPGTKSTLVTVTDDERFAARRDHRRQAQGRRARRRQ